MFRKSDLDFLANEIGADYIVLPCLLDIQRWSKGRFSVGGVRFLQTQVVSGMLGLEIWDTRTGRKVFSATSDITIASEKIKEEPMSMEEAFDIAWYGIIKELPGYWLGVLILCIRIRRPATGSLFSFAFSTPFSLIPFYAERVSWTGS